MASDRQLVANRANALKSTGPRSLAGKARSSRNALLHGLTARPTVLPGEDETEFSELRRAMFASLDPQGALENQLVERATSLIWRMRRCQAFEVALFRWCAHLQAVEHDGEQIEPHPTANETDDGEPSYDADLRHDLSVGRMFEALLSTDLTGRFSRYETSLQRSLSSVLRDLREMQRPRQEYARAALKQKSPDAKNRVQQEEEDYTYPAAQEQRRRRIIGPP